MAYSPIDNTEIDPNSPLTASLMARLRDNPIGIAAGDAGAPAIVNGAIADNAIGLNKMQNNSVGTAELVGGSVTNAKLATDAVHQPNIATGTTSLQGDAIGTTVYNLPQAYRGFTPRIGLSSTQGNTYTFELFGGSGTQVGFWPDAYVRLTRDSGVEVRTWYAVQNYVQDSPPYDLGHGEIAQFILAEVTPGGDIVNVSWSESPPWDGLEQKRALYYDGKHYVISPPTRTGDVKRDLRRALRFATELKEAEVELEAVLRNALLPDSVRDARYLAALIALLSNYYTEVTPAIKNLTMDSRPHLFASADPANRIVMLDPTSNITDRLAYAGDMGYTVGEILMGGHLHLGSVIADYDGPTGVDIVNYHWA